MSHTNVIYSQSTAGLTLAGDASLQVREEQDDYLPFPTLLLRYTDLVDEKLPQARTVALLLRDPHHLPPGGLEEVGRLIADLIDDVMLAHKAMWAQYQRENRPE